MSWKKNESDLFNYLKDNFYPDLEWSEFSNSQYDCYSEWFDYDIELKCRNKHYDDLVIEKPKYEALLLRAKVHNTQPVYVCQTPQGVFGFNLHHGEPISWETRGMPKTSHFSNRQFIDKEVGYLHIKDAKRYD